MKLQWPDLTFGPINLLNCPYISFRNITMKTQHCDQCAHHNFLKDDPVCSKGHKPRFYVPRNALDREGGWKRKCVDYENVTNFMPSPETHDHTDSTMNTTQPKPLLTATPAVWDLVIADMRERDAIVRDKHGMRLQVFDGKDALVAAYQEALDLAMYLRQVIYEREYK